MTRGPGRAVLALALIALVSSWGCAAHWAYRQAEEAAANGDWDLAVARYTKALDKDPKNIGYKIALENARIQASRLHYDKAREHLAANDFEKSVEELEIATKYDPANRSAADDLQILRDRIRRRDEERQQRAQFEQTRARAQAAARVPLPVLSPRSPVPITMRFDDGSLQKILESLGRISGVNVLFDEGFRDKKASVNLSGITFQEALDRITFVNRLFYKVLDQNTIAALQKLAHAGLLSAAAADVLIPAARLIGDLTQVLRLSLDGEFHPEAAPAGLRDLLARVAQEPTLERLEARLRDVQAETTARFDEIVA